MQGVKDIGSATVPVKHKLIADNAKGTFRHMQLLNNCVVCKT